MPSMVVAVIEEEMLLRDFGDYSIQINRLGRQAKITLAWPHSQRKVGDRYCFFKLEYYPHQSAFYEIKYLKKVREEFNDYCEQVIKEYKTLD